MRRWIIFYWDLEGSFVSRACASLLRCSNNGPGEWFPVISLHLLCYQNVRVTPLFKRKCHLLELEVHIFVLLFSFGRRPCVYEKQRHSFLDLQHHSRRHWMREYKWRAWFSKWRALRDVVQFCHARIVMLSTHWKQFEAKRVSLKTQLCSQA